MRKISHISPRDMVERLAKRDPKLTVRKLDRETVLVEGDSNALKFLGYLLLAHAEAPDCGDQFSPGGAGSTLFTKDSTLGFYLHRVPCKEVRRRYSPPKRAARAR